MINEEFIRAYRATAHQKYSARDTILYALGIGARSDPAELNFVYEKRLVAIPSMAATLAREVFWLSDPRSGIDARQALHGEQTLQLHRALPAEGEVRSEVKVVGLYDKGPGKGAVLDLQRKLFDHSSNQLIATLGIRSVVRGHGGFGGTDRGLPQPHPTPQSPPALTIEFKTVKEQALLYRLSGDYNPLHADPAVARAAGYDTPILHGMCTYGFACRAIVNGVLRREVGRLVQFDGRFSRPVYPGDTIVTEIWEESTTQVAFQCRVPERSEVVLSHGLARFS